MDGSDYIYKKNNKSLMAHITVPPNPFWKRFQIRVNIKSFFKPKEVSFENPDECFKCTMTKQKHFIPVFY